MAKELLSKKEIEKKVHEIFFKTGGCTQMIISLDQMDIEKTENVTNLKKQLYASESREEQEKLLQEIFLLA